MNLKSHYEPKNIDFGCSGPFCTFCETSKTSMLANIFVVKKIKKSRKAMSLVLILST